MDDKTDAFYGCEIESRAARENKGVMFNLKRLVGVKPAATSPAFDRAQAARPQPDVRIDLAQSRTFSYELAGPTHHEAALRYFYGRGEFDATIEQDKRNPVDPNAIKVTVEGRLIGYFHAEDCAGFNRWIDWRGYDGRAFKVPATVEFDPDIGLLKGKLRVLLSPPRVVGDLDRTTKKAVDLLLRQSGALCVKHMQREPRDAADRSLAHLVDHSLAFRASCATCGAGGYVATDQTWVAKFGQTADFVRSHPELRPVSGWVEPVYDRDAQPNAHV